MGTIEWIAGNPKRVAQLLAGVVVIVLAVVLVRNIISTSESSTSGLGTEKPTPAPALALPRLDGSGRLALAAYRGRPVVVNFWASWCVPCRGEAPVLERTWRRYRGRGLVVLGVDANDDFAGDARRFARKHGLTYPLVHATDGSPYGHWGVAYQPTTFFVDRRGRVVARVVGSVESSDNAGAFAEGVRRILRTESS